MEIEKEQFVKEGIEAFKHLENGEIWKRLERKIQTILKSFY